MGSNKVKPTNRQKYINYKGIYDNYARAFSSGFYYECLLFEYAILEDCLSRILVHFGLVVVNDRNKFEDNDMIKAYIQTVTNKQLNKISLTKISNKIQLLSSLLDSIQSYNTNDIVGKIMHDKILTVKHLSEIKKILNNDLPKWLDARNDIVHNLCNANIQKFDMQIANLSKDGREFIRVLDNFDKAIITRKVRQAIIDANILEPFIIENKSIRVSDDIFYRRIEDCTYVYQTSKHKVYEMSAFCCYVLDYYKAKHKSSLVNYIISKTHVKIQNDDFYGLNDLVENLISNEILVINSNQNTDEENAIENKLYGNILPGKNILHNAMFELTYRCKEHCAHCYCVTDVSEGELSTIKIKSLINELYEMNVMELTFTGGDLFVRSDAFEILEYAYSKNFLINIFTNGIALTDNDLFRLQKIHPKSVSLSLYDVIPEKHDEFTAVKGSFRKTTDVIRKLRALGITVNVKTNVTNDNKLRLNKFIKMVNELGANIEVSLSITPKNDGDLAPTQMRIDSIEEYKKAIKTVFPYLNEASEIKNMYNNIDRKMCWAGEYGISINPYGKVFACNALLIEIGDVNKQTIKEIWEHSTKLKEIRQYNMSMVSCVDKCEYVQWCTFCPGTALTEGHDPLKCYEEACNITKAQVELRKEKK